MYKSNKSIKRIDERVRYTDRYGKEEEESGGYVTYLNIISRRSIQNLIVFTYAVEKQNRIRHLKIT